MPKNRGRLINFINGITGVSAGGQAVVNLPVNQRYHRLKLQCAANNYAAGTFANSKITGVGVGGTTTLTVVNGVVTAAAVATGGTGYVTADTITVLSPTGSGLVLTVTATAGVITALAVTNGGVPSAISPASMLSSVKLLVNGVNMRDIDPANIIRIAQANGTNPNLGELPIYFTAPWRNVNQANDVTSWDLFGQSTFTVQIGINSNITNPSVTGIMEFDYERNLAPDSKGVLQPYLQPTAQHQFTLPIVSGVNSINTIPFDFPISRIWFKGSVAAAITQLEVYQDANKVFEGTLEQIKEAYQDYGFQFGRAVFTNSTAATGLTPLQYEPQLTFDAAFISDPDQRWSKALVAEKSLVLRVYSSSAQNLTILTETLPGAYSS